MLFESLFTVNICFNVSSIYLKENKFRNLTHIILILPVRLLDYRSDPLFINSVFNKSTICLTYRIYWFQRSKFWEKRCELNTSIDLLPLELSWSSFTYQLMFLILVEYILYLLVHVTHFNIIDKVNLIPTSQCKYGR